MQKEDLEKSNNGEHSSCGSTEATVEPGMCVLFTLPIKILFLAVATPNINGKSTETLVKKAMQSIMLGRSALFTKTDLSQICNRAAVRQEAVRRLVAVHLLQHGHNFWIEPNRSKREPKKDSKRLIREGWLK